MKKLHPQPIGSQNQPQYLSEWPELGAMNLQDAIYRHLNQRDKKNTPMEFVYVMPPIHPEDAIVDEAAYITSAGLDLITKHLRESTGPKIVFISTLEFDVHPLFNDRL